MALINEFEKQGNFLFKYRGQFPVLLFVLAIPFIYFHRIESVATTYVLTYVSIVLSFLGVYLIYKTSKDRSKIKFDFLNLFFKKEGKS